MTSFAFFLCIQASMIDSGAIEGTNEFTALEDAIAAANAAAQTASELAEQYQQNTKINLKIDSAGTLVDGDGQNVDPKIDGDSIITEADAMTTVEIDDIMDESESSNASV